MSILGLMIHVLVLTQKKSYLHVLYAMKNIFKLTTMCSLASFTLWLRT